MLAVVLMVNPIYAFHQHFTAHNKDTSNLPLLLQIYYSVMDSKKEIDDPDSYPFHASMATLFTILQSPSCYPLRSGFTGFGLVPDTHAPSVHTPHLRFTLASSIYFSRGVFRLSDAITSQLLSQRKHYLIFFASFFDGKTNYFSNI